MPTAIRLMPDHESSQVRSAQSARSYDGLGSPAKPSAARRSWPRWSSTRLLDDVIRPQQQRLRDGEPKRLRGLEVDDQLGLHRLLHRQLRRSFALEKPTRIVALEAVRIGKTVSVADQAAGGDEFGGMPPLRQRRDAPPTLPAARGVRRGRGRPGLPLTARVLARRDPGSTVAVLWPSEYKPRVDGPTVHQNLIVQVRPRRVPGRADQADPGTLLDRLSSYHVRLREMSIEGADLMTVIDDNRPAVAATPSDEGHGAARWRANKCAPAGADVYAGVKSRPGCARRAEIGTDRAVHRPSRPQRRKRLLATVRSREVLRRCAMGRSLGDAVAAGHEPPVTGRDLGRLRAHDQDHGHGHYRPHREATHFQPSRAPHLSQSLREKVPMPVLRATAVTDGAAVTADEMPALKCPGRPGT